MVRRPIVDGQVLSKVLSRRDIDAVAGDRLGVLVDCVAGVGSRHRSAANCIRAAVRKVAALTRGCSRCDVTRRRVLGRHRFESLGLPSRLVSANAEMGVVNNKREDSSSISHAALLNQIVGDLPETVGVVEIEYVGSNARGVARALVYHLRFGAVFEVTAGDSLNVGARGQ
jgi:hypothetical protein